jgi:hypothetical protein
MTATAQKNNGAQRRLDDPARYRLEAQIGFVLRRAHQKATGIFNAVMGEFGVTPTHFAALAKLDDAVRVSQNELGRLTAMDPATVWGVVNRLMKQGFVAQSPDPDDARLVIGGVDGGGTSGNPAHEGGGRRGLARDAPPFTDEEARQLLALLGRLGG